ncbi:hypothetical protein LZG00_12735 [Rhodobacteraceae bacterium LMO-12]|nr:hypothetical protein [Rhodobacteraceae bacterium LMO-JJ12]
MSYFVKTAAVAFGLFWLAGAASAQNVSQSQLVDEAGSGAYPVTIVGSNGLTYRCRRDLVVVDGKRVRYCVAALRGGLAPNAGMGVAAALALGLVAVAASDDS